MTKPTPLSLDDRIDRLLYALLPHGCRVLDQLEEPSDGCLTLSAEFSPLLDIPDGYLVEGPADALPMREHRALMGLDSGLDVTSLWGVLARAAQRYQDQNDAGNGREVVLLASLPRAPASVGPFIGRKPGAVARSEMTGEGMRAAAVDILSSIARWRTDLSDEQFADGVELYLGRNHADGEPLTVKGWEKVIPSSRGGESVLTLPRAALDDAMGQALRETRGERLGARIAAGLIPSTIELEGDLGSAEGGVGRRKFVGVISLKLDDPYHARTGPVVKIYDRTYEGKAGFPSFGQMTSSYFCSSLAERVRGQAGEGGPFGPFSLDGGVPVWTLSGDSYRQLCELAALHDDAFVAARDAQVVSESEPARERQR